MKNNVLVFKELDENSFKIITNYDTKQFHKISFNKTLLDNLFFANVKNKNKLIVDVKIEEVNKDLYFYSSKQDVGRININNNELILFSINEHPDYHLLIKEIKKFIEREIDA